MRCHVRDAPAARYSCTGFRAECELNTRAGALRQELPPRQPCAPAAAPPWRRRSCSGPVRHSAAQHRGVPRPAAHCLGQPKQAGEHAPLRGEGAVLAPPPPPPTGQLQPGPPRGSVRLGSASTSPLSGLRTCSIRRDPLGGARAGAVAGACGASPNCEAGLWDMQVSLRPAAGAGQARRTVPRPLKVDPC